MGYCIKSRYLDYIHVPSKAYALECSKEFNVSIKKFIVIPFGIPDTLKKWENSKTEYSDYILAIGRSNRDYDFLVDVWKNMPKHYKLLIICDQYKPNKKIPDNVIVRRDITGEQQFPYIYNCKLMIIPIDKENICSGDTVLLKAMSFNKTVVITKPSTLSEVYIENRKNGISIEKDEKKFIYELNKLLEDKELIEDIGIKARKSYLDNYSRYAMGKKLGKQIK